MNGKTGGGYAWIRAAMVLAALVCPALAGYGFGLTPRGDTIQHVSPSGTAEFYFSLVNTGTSTDVFKFDCRVVSGVPGWTVVYCVRGVCVEPGISVYDTLPAAGTDTTAKVSVYTDTTQGEGVASLRVNSMGDPALAESIGTHTIVGAGIEESPGAVALPVSVQVAPEPVSRGRAVTLSFSTSGPLNFCVALFNSAGVRVRLVASGIVPGGRHVINWRPDPLLARGVYLLRLTAADESAVRKLVVE